MTEILAGETRIIMPDMIGGAGETPAQGACVMQAVAWLASDGAWWTDMPECTHPVFRRVAIWINDSISRQTRQQLWSLVPRLIGTASGDRGTDARIGVQLAVWSAERVLPLIKDRQRHEIAAGRIKRARAWLNKPAAAADAYAAAAAAAAADAAA